MNSFPVAPCPVNQYNDYATYERTSGYHSKVKLWASVKPCFHNIGEFLIRNLFQKAFNLFSFSIFHIKEK